MTAKLIGLDLLQITWGFFNMGIFSANQGVYVSGLQSSQARLFKIGSQGHDLEQLGTRSGVQVNLLPGHLLLCRGSQEGLLNVVKYVVGVLGPIPSGYDPDDGSEEGVQVPARNRSDHANTLL